MTSLNPAFSPAPPSKCPLAATLAAYVVSLLYLARRPVHQNLTNRWSRRMKLATADDVNLDDTSWNNDELLPDPDRPAVYSL